MRRTILIGLGLFILFSTDAFSGRLDRENPRVYYPIDRVDVDTKVRSESPSAVRGKRGRKYARRFSLRQNLISDKARIFDEYGYTPHRLRINFAGKRTERWKYYSLGVEFLFDVDSNLIATRDFPPEGNHID